jgi:hypothetical protein
MVASASGVESDNLWDTFAIWQYVNSSNDQKSKKECQDASLRYICNTRWTSDKSSWRYEIGGTDEGSVTYNKLGRFFRDLKNHKDYDIFKYACNYAAKQVGLIPDSANDLPKDSGSNKTRRHQAEQGVAALNFGDVLEVVPGMDVYQYRGDNVDVYQQAGV